MHPKNKKPINSYKPAGMDVLLRQLRDLIISARQKVVFTVNTLQVQTYWEVGRHIIEFEQNGAHRANYGTKLLDRLAEKLTQEFGKGFDISNLRNMRLFFKAFPIRDALRHELSWTHYRTLLHLDDVRRHVGVCGRLSRRSVSVSLGRLGIDVECLHGLDLGRLGVGGGRQQARKCAGGSQDGRHTGRDRSTRP